MLSHQAALDDKVLQYSSILDEKYKIIEKIGEGRYSKVKLAIDLETRKTIAIKIMRNSHLNTPKKVESFINEILSEMNHTSLIKILYASLNGEYRKYNGNVSKVIYYIMKIADFGELYKLLELTLNFQEKYARFYFKQLIDGLEYLSLRGIAHQDIKLENLLIGKNTQLKVVDFGFSCKTIDKNNQRIKQKSCNPVGSPGYFYNFSYNSPEQFYAEYYLPENADLFAAGCVLFQMVINSSPFKNTQNQDPYYQRLQNNSQSYWKIFEGLASPTVEFKDLIECMFRRDPAKRLTIEEVKHHPWLQGQKFKLGDIPTLYEIKKEMAQRTQIINNIQYEKVKKKREQKIKKYENFIKKPSVLKDTFENSINELLHKYQNQVKQINNLIQYNYKKRKIQKQRKHKSAKYNQENSRELPKRVETPKSSDSSDSI